MGEKKISVTRVSLFTLVTGTENGIPRGRKVIQDAREVYTEGNDYSFERREKLISSWILVNST